MSEPSADDRRHVGVFGATLVGIGGILGGGLLILAGTAINMAGPAMLLAFALNGVVAWLTAMSVAEISTAFPESGGAYTFAKKVLSVRAAFAVGWVLWFAYIVAGVLYALSFAAFTVILLKGGCSALDLDTHWLDGRNPILFLATIATVAYSVGLVRKASGGGQAPTIGKIVVFVILIGAGLIAFARKPISESADSLLPFFSGGIDGIIAAMGVTFISLQGFEMVSAIAGEVKDPQKTIPRSVFLSLGISFAIYMPLLILVATAGTESGQTITQLAAKDADTVVAAAARRFLGEPGYWAVIAAIALATLSALQANLLTASRVAHSMARDHTLPSVLEREHPTRGTPIMSIYATALATVAIMFMLPDLSSAGAAASLIFLLAFALTHFTAYLARKRAQVTPGGYATPWFPVVPIVGGAACAGLGVFQALVVPDAGGILLIWFALGVLLYFALFKGRAEAADASAEALDPRLNLLRGKSPLVLLPIANPRNARSMVDVANAMAPSQFARVLLLTIVRAPKDGQGDPLAQLADSQDAVRQALTASYAAGHAPEALITAASEPWREIRRIADEHHCESLLFGLPSTLDPTTDRKVEELLNDVDCDVGIMRAPDDWRIETAKRVLVPVAGKGEEAELRARILATLSRDRTRQLVFMTVIPAAANEDEMTSAVRALDRQADLNIPTKPTVEVVRSDDVATAIIAEAARFDLVVLGLRRSRSGRKMLGTINRKIASEAPCAVMLLSRRTTAINETIGDIYRPLRDVAQVPLSLIPNPWGSRKTGDD
ncbi:MAG TPA: amino acid permease [Kofleriaceae bacterium]